MPIFDTEKKLFAHMLTFVHQAEHLQPKQVTATVIKPRVAQLRDRWNEMQREMRDNCDTIYGAAQTGGGYDMDAAQSCEDANDRLREELAEIQSELEDLAETQPEARELLTEIADAI